MKFMLSIVGPGGNAKKVKPKKKVIYPLKQVTIFLENYFTMEKFLHETNQIDKWKEFNKEKGLW